MSRNATLIAIATRVLFEDAAGGVLVSQKSAEQPATCLPLSVFAVNSPQHFPDAHPVSVGRPISQLVAFVGFGVSGCTQHVSFEHAMLESLPQ
jgi:hypothetical protein